MRKFPADALYTTKPVDEPISRRDRFAMAALAGLMADRIYNTGFADRAAKIAANQADALIAELDND